MNYLVVRTRLQAIIALELIERGILSRPFTLVELYQHHLKEDSKSVYEYYAKLSSLAKTRKVIVQMEGFWVHVLWLIKACLYARLTGGAIYFACLDFYPLALATKFCPGLKVFTFDDGTANTMANVSKYYSTEPLPGSGLKRRLSRLLFPAGACSYLRSRVLRHYSIYPGMSNVVTQDKVEPIDLSWAKYLHARDCENLKGSISSLMLGTVFHQLGDRGLMLEKIRDQYLENCDIYVPHPREILSFNGDKVVDSSSPVEAIIDFLANKFPITVYHFNSSALLPFTEHANVKVVDLTELCV